MWGDLDLRRKLRRHLIKYARIRKLCAESISYETWGVLDRHPLAGRFVKTARGECHADWLESESCTAFTRIGTSQNRVDCEGASSYDLLVSVHPAKASLPWKRVGE